MRPRLAPAPLLAALALSPGPARAQAPPPGLAPDREMVRVTVREGDSCEAISERLYGDRDYYYVVARHVPGLDSVIRTECDRALRPGSVLALPRRAVADEEGADARVTAVKRQVRARPPRAETWRPARVGDELYRGHRVSTLERSAAELTFRDLSRLHVRERTLVVIYGAKAGTARRRSSKAVLERGALRSRLGELSGDRRLRVDTPSARAELRAGEAVVSVDPQEVSRIANHRGGAATVSTPDGRGRVKVYPGMGTSVRKGRLPERPRPLPTPPEWPAGAPELFVGLVGRGATVRASWSGVAGADAYVVEVIAGGGAGGPAETAEVSSKVRSVELRGLPAGIYAARVATVDSSGFESRPSAPLGLTVVELEPLPPLAAGPEQLYRPPRLVAGARLTLPRGISCSLSDLAGEGPASGSLVLVDPGTPELRCRDLDGREAAPLRLEVVALSARISGLGEGEPLSLVRGAETIDVAVTLDLDAELPLPASTTLEAGPGLELASTSTERGGRHLAAEVRARAEAPEDSFLDVVVPGAGGGALLARLAVVTRSVEEPEVEVAGDEPEGPEDEGAAASWLSGPGVPHEGSALLLQRGTFGVRDERRPGTGATLAMAWSGDRRAREERGEGPADRFVVAGGLRASFLDERLRLDVGVHVSDDEGPGDGWVAVSSRLLASRLVGLAVEVGLWVPFSDQDEAGEARLLPSIDASFRVGSRVTLRTRQGALFDLSARGARLWSSAYGVDVWAVGPLSAGAEAILVVGDDEGSTLVAPAAGAGLSLRLGIVTATVAARYAFTDDAADLLGQIGVIGTVRLAADGG